MFCHVLIIPQFFTFYFGKLIKFIYKVIWHSGYLFAVLEKTLESLLDSKEIKPVNPKGNQSWIFIGRTDAEAEAPILSPPDLKSQLAGKDPNAGKDWGQEEKGKTEDEMVGWHLQLDGCEWANSTKW